MMARPPLDFGITRDATLRLARFTRGTRHAPSNQLRRACPEREAALRTRNADLRSAVGVDVLACVALSCFATGATIAMLQLPHLTAISTFSLTVPSLLGIQSGAKRTITSIAIAVALGVHIASLRLARAAFFATRSICNLFWCRGSEHEESHKESTSERDRHGVCKLQM